MDEMDVETVLVARKGHEFEGDELSPKKLPAVSATIFKHTAEEWEKIAIRNRTLYASRCSINPRTHVPGFTPHRGHYEE